MNSAQIDSFLQIADVGSFSKAEDLLHITKTALKRQIDRLEDELGFHLFIRNASGLILTDAGAEFYKRMKAIVADCRTLVADCQRIDLSAKLVIRIGMYKISQMWSWYLRLEKAASIRIEQQLIPFNPVVTDTIANTGFNEYFGFTQQEVNKILEDTGTVQYAKQMKEWYDGYHMGEIDVYCPWDVMNYLRELQRNPKAQPVSYWKNTSDNAIIRSFIDFAGNSITDKMETLLSGGYILQDIDENLTYDYLHSSESNLWSILYMTGYLTEARISEGKTAFSPDTKALKIPNVEIREIFETTVMKWFADSVKKWNRTAILQALWNQKPEIITREMNLLLWNTISYHDYKEDFYHAFLTGIFMGAGEQIESNKEHGLGRPDLVIIDKANGKVAIFEVKYSQSMKQLNKDCDKALAQMKERKYAEDYKDRYKDIFCYGISFYKKECLVKMLES